MQNLKTEIEVIEGGNVTFQLAVNDFSKEGFVFPKNIVEVSMYL